MEKISVITTVLNERESILALLEALRVQTRQPGEVIVVDGGSTDGTFELIRQFQRQQPKFPLQVWQKKGNRSVGRNYALAKARDKLVAITDAGCVPEPNWLGELAAKQRQTQAEVVAGYYRGAPGNNFAAAAVPYALVMPDRVNENNFLPATRSMLITKQIWQKAGKFDEKLSDNEDYAFAKKLEKMGVKMAFAPRAVVAWQPPENFGSFYRMIFRFARGDIQAGILRPKVVLIFARYLAGLVLLFFLPSTVLPLILLYLLWAILKNKKYVPRGWYWLPLLQVLSDLAAMQGSFAGFLGYIFNSTTSGK